MATKTQHGKAVSLTSIVTAALNGKPINVPHCDLYDLDSVDMDDDREIVDEYDDNLEVTQRLREVAREEFFVKQDKSKGGIDSNETKKKDETDETETPLQTE